MSGASANMSPIVSREHVGNVIGNAMRLYVGRGRRYSVKQLSNATGVKDRVIECAMTDAGSLDYRPLPLEALLSIAGFLGSDFTSEALAIVGQGAFDLPDDGDPDPTAMMVGATEDTARIVRCAADGRFDNDERTELRSVGQNKIRRGQQLVAMAARRAA